LKPADDGRASSGGENLLEKMDLSNMFYDSSQGGAGGKMFRLSFDVSQFRPEEISITTHDQRLVVHAKHEGKSTFGFRLIPRLHDRANIEQKSNRCIQNTRADCLTFA